MNADTVSSIVPSTGDADADADAVPTVVRWSFGAWAGGADPFSWSVSFATFVSITSFFW